jgi:hypothetical protein
MQRPSKQTLVAGIVVCVLGGAMLAAAGEPQKPAAETGVLVSKAARSRGAGADENIKKDSPVNDAKAQVQAPPDKGGAKSRGMLCRFHVDNRTQWKIQIFVNGQLDGLVGPYGDAYGTYTEGNMLLYARALFDDGSVLTWGPRTAVCQGDFSWTLEP